MKKDKKSVAHDADGEQRHVLTQKLDLDDYSEILRLAQEHCVSVQYMLEQCVKFILAMPKKEVPFLWKYRE